MHARTAVVLGCAVCTSLFVSLGYAAVAYLWDPSTADFGWVTSSTVGLLAEVLPDFAVQVVVLVLLINGHWVTREDVPVDRPRPEVVRE